MPEYFIPSLICFIYKNKKNMNMIIKTTFSATLTVETYIINDCGSLRANLFPFGPLASPADQAQ